jgi:hypothetical protein
LLAEIGYDRILYWDNFGRFLCSPRLSDRRLVHQLHAYTADHAGAFAYYDVCVFHAEDGELAARVVANEERHLTAIAHADPAPSVGDERS